MIQYISILKIPESKLDLKKIYLKIDTRNVWYVYCSLIFSQNIFQRSQIICLCHINLIHLHLFTFEIIQALHLFVIRKKKLREKYISCDKIDGYECQRKSLKVRRIDNAISYIYKFYFVLKIL